MSCVLEKGNVRCLHMLSETQEGETVRVVTTAELKRLLAERGVSQTEIRACLTRSDLDDLFWKIQAASSDSDHFIVM